MTVTPERRRAVRVVRFGIGASAWSLGMALAACGATSGPDSATGAEHPDTRTTVPNTSAAVTTAPTVPVATAPVADRAPALPRISAVAALGYPRDLLDRGRVNVKVSQDGTEPFVVLEKQLVVTTFTTPPVEERRSIIPPGGGVVALQTLIGDVVDCETAGAVTATLRIAYTYEDRPSVEDVDVPLVDSSVLDDIRRRRCTQRRVLAENDVALGVPVVDDETLLVDLTVRRSAGDARLSFDAFEGTVLFGVATGSERGAPERVLESDDAAVVIALRFVVNRCDSHAVAETTRKFGLALHVGLDGAAPERVEVPIDPLVPALDTMLQRCRDRTGG